MNNLSLFMNRVVKRISLAALAGVCDLIAGNAAGQLVQFPTGNAAWTVDITYRNAAASATPTPTPGGETAGDLSRKKATKLQVVQANNLRLIQVTWTAGPKTELWTIPKLPAIFKEYPNGVVFALDEGGIPARTMMSRIPNDVSAFDWISPDCLQEKDPISFEGKLCYHYKGTVNLPSMDTKKSSSSQEAWIDSKTLLPVALNTDATFCKFTFQDPPAGRLVPPKNFQVEITDYAESWGYPVPKF
jgi:hypothetical protein